MNIRHEEKAESRGGFYGKKIPFHTFSTAKVDKPVNNFYLEVFMREIKTELIEDAIREMCIEANLSLSEDVRERLLSAEKEETSELGIRILSQLKENLSIAERERIPICQDTGMAIVFMEIGQEVHFAGKYLSDAVNEGVRRGYREGFLRKSVVSDPLLRVNSGDNTPAILHTKLVPGDQVKITVAPKGFGSENMSRVCMLKPADGEEGVKEAVLETVRLAGPNACPPMVIGVGVGGDFEMCAILAKKALTRNLSEHSALPHIKAMEEELLCKVNELNIGPGGLRGKCTALGVNIETYPTHIAGLPVAINICCHVNRHKTRIL